MFGRNGCRQTRELLSPYLDERLSPKERQRVEAHLESCEVCAGELEALRTTVSLLRLTPVVKPPRSFTLREEFVPRRVWSGASALRWSTAMAVALLLVVVGGDVFSSLAPGGVSSPATQPMQESLRQKGVAPASEAPEVAAQRATQSAVASDQSAPLSSQGEASKVLPPSLTTPVTDGGAQDALSAQPTAVAESARSLPATGLSLLRIVEVGLGVLSLALVVSVLVLGRVRRFGGR